MFTSSPTLNPPNYRVSKSQLPLFSHNPQLISIRESWFMRDIINDAGYITIYEHGNSSIEAASNTSGVRPYFCIA